MPNAALTDAIKEAYASAKTEPVIETLQLSHASGSGDVFIVADNVNHDFALEDSSIETFTACGFRLSLPPSGEDGLQELTIEIDNVDRAVSDFLASVEDSQTPVEVTYRPYLLSEPDGPQMNPPLVLYLREITMTNISIQGRASFADILNRSFPSILYRRETFPSLGN